MPDNVLLTGYVPQPRLSALQPQTPPAQDPKITIDSLVQIGIRTMNPTQLRVSQRHGVKVFGPSEVAQALLALPRGPVYVSIDLDGLNPAFAPGVSHPEPGGEEGRIKQG